MDKVELVQTAIKYIQYLEAQLSANENRLNGNIATNNSLSHHGQQVMEDKSFEQLQQKAHQSGYQECIKDVAYFFEMMRSDESGASHPKSQLLGHLQYIKSIGDAHVDSKLFKQPNPLTPSVQNQQQPAEALTKNSPRSSLSLLAKPTIMSAPATYKKVFLLLARR